MTGRTVESTTDKPDVTAKLQKAIDDKSAVQKPAPDAKAAADKAAKAASDEKAKAAQAAAAAASETAETTTTDGTTEEVTEDAGNSAGGETVETEAGAGEGAGKSKEGQAGNGFKKRIDKLAKQRAQAEADRDYWKNEALKLKFASTPGEKKVETTAKPVDDGRPKKEQFKTEAEYLDAHADWRYDQRQKAEKAASSQDQVRTARENLVKEHNARATDFHKVQTDYNDVLAEVDDIQLPLPSLDLIMRNSRGPEIAYAMAKDRENFERISKLGPVEFAEEVGAIKAKLGTPSKGNPGKKITTGAAPPVKPVGGSTVLPKKTLREVGESDSAQQEWRALRKQGVRQ
jgi:hypothetical protein